MQKPVVTKKPCSQAWEQKCRDDKKPGPYDKETSQQTTDRHNSQSPATGQYPRANR
jgi:hypothetical protein